MGLTLREIAELVQGQLVVDGADGADGADSADSDALGATLITGVGPIELAGPGQLAALDDERFLEAAKKSQATALLVPPKLASRIDRPRIVVPVPQIAQNRVIDRLALWTLPWNETGRHATAIVDPAAKLDADVAIGPYAVVGPHARIGAGTRLYPHAIVEGGATIGARCRIHAHAVVCAPAIVGDDCVIGHGAVVAGEGFGFGFGPTGAVRLRHLGRVVLGDRVEIGNHATIDRARFGDTRVGNDVKLDSHVHLGHNVTVGARTVIAAQTGIAGSTDIGENCLLGGQVGVGDHLKIGSGVRLAAKSGVAASLEEPGDYFGYWAKPRGEAMRELVALGRLPVALKALERLERELAELRARLPPAPG